LNYFLLLRVKKLLLFLEAEYLSESFSFLLIEQLLLGLDILPFRYLGHTIDIANITSLVLPNVFSIIGIFLVA
jgi:hypothetical protein